ITEPSQISHHYGVVLGLHGSDKRAVPGVEPDLAGVGVDRQHPANLTIPGDVHRVVPGKDVWSLGCAAELVLVQPLLGDLCRLVGGDGRLGGGLGHPPWSAHHPTRTEATHSTRYAPAVASHRTVPGVPH